MKIKYEKNTLHWSDKQEYTQSYKNKQELKHCILVIYNYQSEESVFLVTFIA